jgi:hypothetical protein
LGKAIIAGDVRAITATKARLGRNGDRVRTAALKAGVAGCGAP